MHVREVFLLVCVSAIISTAAPAQTFKALVSFGRTNGSAPSGPPIQGIDGNLFGTTVQGGTDTYTCNTEGCGTVYKISPYGALTVLHSFDGNDGIFPNSLLVLGKNGIMYGSTYSGGIHKNCDFGIGCGTIFSITMNGQFTTLHNFAGPDGAYVSNLVLGADGDLYGTTSDGGPAGTGTFFKITPGGILATLQDSSLDVYDLILGPDGNFYGFEYGDSVVRVTPSGAVSVIGNLNLAVNTFPAALVFGNDGNLYGTIASDATSPPSIFQLTISGTLTILYSFGGTGNVNPATLIEGNDDNFYGTTAQSSGNGGTVFEITPAGVLTTLAVFDYSNGSAPDGLVQDTSGTFYGTTSSGGENTCACGTIYSLSTGLGQFVEPVPALGAVGSKVEILGTNRSGARFVNFNGTPAHFLVFASSIIVAEVPAGATSGPIEVVAQGKTLSSNPVFSVQP